MAEEKRSPAMQFIVDSLKSNRTVSYKAIAEAAAKKKITVYPIMFGRAQALLGIVKSAKRGEGKAAKAKAAAPKAAVPGKRGPGRPRKMVASAQSLGTLDGIVAAVKASEQLRMSYRSAIEKIQAILTSVLG